MSNLFMCISCKRAFIENGQVYSCGNSCHYEFGEPKEKNDLVTEAKE